MCRGETTERSAPAKQVEPTPPIVPKVTEAERQTQAKAAREAERLALLTAEWNAYRDTLISHDATALTPEAQAMWRPLIEAASLVEELHMLQVHPNDLKWRDLIEQSGSDIEKKMFARNQMPWCEDNPSPDCCALPECPPKTVGADLWPAGWQQSDFGLLMHEIARDELLSPFTVVRRNEERQLTAVPYAKSPLLGVKMRKLAGLLREAAATADKPLKKLLMARADAFESDSPFPYDDSDYDWIALKGDWEVTVGPYEVYRDPFQVKAFFGMIIGREDQRLTAELARFKSGLQEMEEALASLVGGDIYKGRTLDPRIAIRAIDVWMASGEARMSRGATVAYHLPNRGRAVDEGLYKKVILVNHAQAFEPVARERAGLLLDNALVEGLGFRDDLVNVTLHELSHGFGAYHDMKVTSREGQSATVKQHLMEYDSLMEEVKADAVGLWLNQHLQSKGALDRAGLERRYVAAVVHVLGLFQYPLEETYPKMAAIELGWFLDAGALTWDAKEGRLGFVFDKMQGAIAALAKKVATLQLTGDRRQAAALFDTYLSKDEKGRMALKGTLASLRQTALDRFKAAGIKSPSLRYEVVGLPSPEPRPLNALSQ